MKASVFGAFNEPFEPVRTPFDCLSRAQPSRLVRIPKKLRIDIVGGTRHQVGSNIDQPLAAYRPADLENVRHEFYPRGHHESLNELNRDEATPDLIRWLNSVVSHVVAPPLPAVPAR